VIGLKREGAELLIDRIRWNAERLHMWMADDTDCRPNLIIAFVEDGKDELAGIVDRQPWLFADLTTAQRRALLADGGPGAGVDHRARRAPATGCRSSAARASTARRRSRCGWRTRSST
jgi:hypothetical protein